MSNAEMTDDLAFAAVRATSAAAIAASRMIGRGDEKAADQAAVDALRTALNKMEMKGRIVIGEGERDEAPMLYIGEKVGRGGESVDIAVDPLEGTNLCATGSPNAITVLAAAERGGLLHAPDIYMEKLVVGPDSAGKVDINAPVADNLRSIARTLSRDIKDLTVMTLDRPRHEQLIADIRAAGARIRLITDGDLSAGISAAVLGSGVHAVMGIGGAPEGVLTAAAMRCLNGEIQGKLVMTKPSDRERCERMGIADLDRVFYTRDLAPGKDISFACAGVTDGNLLKGVRFFGYGIRTHCMIMTTRPHKVRFIDAIHARESASTRFRF